MPVGWKKRINHRALVFDRWSAFGGRYALAAEQRPCEGVVCAGCEEKVDAEFVRWILHDGRTKQKWAKMERIGEKYPEKYVLIRNQRELDGFLKEL